MVQIDQLEAHTFVVLCTSARDRLGGPLLGDKGDIPIPKADSTPIRSERGLASVRRSQVGQGCGQ